MAVKMSEEQFDALVDKALATVPDELLAHVEHCLMFIEEQPPDDRWDLFGLYEGIPLPERESGTIFTQPDRIRIFRRPILNACQTPAEVEHEIAVTVVHEIGHYFGISEERLHELGWG